MTARLSDGRLTIAQFNLLKRLFPDGVVRTRSSARQAPRQALNFEVLSFQALCEFNSLGVPPSHEIRRRLRVEAEAGTEDELT